MKKLLAMLLAVTMVAGLALTGCGDGKEEGSGGDAKEGAIKSVGFIVGALGDKSFNDISYEGIKSAGEKLGITYKAVEYGTDKAKMEPALLDSADAYDMIIFSGNEFLEILERHADEFPDTKFVCFDIEPGTEIKMSNVFAITFRQCESDYLAGVFAMTLSKTKVVGFLGGMEAPVINDFLVGFIEGVQRVDANGKVALVYNGSYTDAPKAKEFSLMMVNNNKADVLHQVAGGAGLGVFQACQEAEIWGIGVDADQYEFFKDEKPEIAKVIITSAEKRVNVALETAITDTYNGTATYYGTREDWGVEKGVADLAENEYYKAQAPQECKDAVNAAREDIKSGKVKVTTGYGMAQDELNKRRDSVKP